jgi:hypothetical protein
LFLRTKCASKTDIAFTLSGTKVCRSCLATVHVCTVFPSICLLCGWVCSSFHAVGMGLRHYPGNREIRTCEEHKRTASSLPTAHEQQSIQAAVHILAFCMSDAWQIPKAPRWTSIPISFTFCGHNLYPAFLQRGRGNVSFSACVCVCVCVRRCLCVPPIQPPNQLTNYFTW